MQSMNAYNKSKKVLKCPKQKKKLEKKEKGKLATANVFPRQARVEKKDKREIERIKPHQTFSCINQSINQRMIYSINLSVNPAHLFSNSLVPLKLVAVQIPPRPHRVRRDASVSFPVEPRFANLESILTTHMSAFASFSSMGLCELLSTSSRHSSKWS